MKLIFVIVALIIIFMLVYAFFKRKSHQLLRNRLHLRDRFYDVPHLNVTIKAVLSIAVFVICAYVASSDFEKILVAGIGFIYVAVDYGITHMRQLQYEHHITNLQMQFIIFEKVAADEEVDYDYLNRQLDLEEQRDDELTSDVVIMFGAYLIISAGCLYIVSRVLSTITSTH